MSKVRIYELARELGVDNRLILQKASEIGVPGRLSHSSSLDADEADQIRRAMIRQAVGRESKESEVLTTRVVKATGERESVVERRKGDVIRRRKQAPSPDAPGSSCEQESELTGGGQAESHSEAAVEEAPESHRDEAPVEPQIEAGAGQESTASVEEVETIEIVEVGEGESEPAPLAAAAEVQPSVAVSADESKKPGPRVLGRIALPQKKAAPAVRPDSGRVVSAQPVARARTVDEEEEGGRDGKKKKGRKREISRGDLLDYEGRDARRAGPRATRSKSRDDSGPELRESVSDASKARAVRRAVRIGEAITVGELAREMSLKAGEVISKLIELGVLATINQSIDKETAQIVAEDLGFEVESTSFNEADMLVDTTPDLAEDLAPRAPVVTVMGHVDHGKTSLLDKIRQTSVAAKEHGGITQHIGAYRVQVPGKGWVTFIDTPGHAAFTSMRARGAKVTDIVVLVVAADDGVMPQTIEALNHAKAANVPIIVAVNKMDKTDANPDRIKQQLAEHGLQPEDWGGDTMFVPVSALKGTGISELLEGLLLTAEMKELKANPKRRAVGTVIETKQEKGRGTVTTLLVQSGTLRIGDVFVAGAEAGRVRSMTDHAGMKIEEAGPSTPVEITGIAGVPYAGDDFVVVESEAQSREVAARRAQKRQAAELRTMGPISLEEFSKRANSMAAAELNLILKTDVHGSLEAVREALEKLSTPKVRVRVIHAAVGGVIESDVQLAAASRAIVVGFGVRAESRALSVAESGGVELRFYRVIYELLEDVKKAMAGLLAPVRQEVRLGRVEVRETFTIPKTGTVAGCYVVDGLIRRGSFVRLLRDSRVVHEGKMASLRRFKDDVREVQSGFECGIVLDGYNDVKAGDAFEVFEVKEVAASLD